jgi:hypothetical protein
LPSPPPPDRHVSQQSQRLFSIEQQLFMLRLVSVCINLQHFCTRRDPPSPRLACTSIVVGSPRHENGNDLTYSDFKD